MIFRISETLIEFRARQTGEKHKTVKTGDFDTQFNPSNPGMISQSFHLAAPQPFIWPVLKSRWRRRTAADFRGMHKLKQAAGKRFKAGVVLYDGEAAMLFGDGLYAVPMRQLWEAA